MSGKLELYLVIYFSMLCVDVNFNSGLPEEIRNVLHLPFGQLMAYGHSISRGLNPDLPENLNAVVIL